MKKIEFLIALSFISIITLTTVPSCKKKANNSPIVDSDVSAANDNNLAEGSFNDVQNIVDQSVKGNLVFYLPTSNVEMKQISEIEKSNCSTIIHDSLSNPKTITIDFGNLNCLCNDGKSRRGKILVSYIGHYRDSASVHTITFDNYYVDNNQLIGTKTVTNNGHNKDGNLTYSVHVDGQVIKANNGGTITWISDRTRVWTAGSNTTTFIDDEFSITGKGSGMNSSGNSFTTLITSPLVRALNCRWFKSGIITLTPLNKPTRTIDYGAGTCDANATVTINGKAYPIILN
jgi:hypothetical protein